jgi:hypothetical protein
MGPACPFAGRAPGEHRAGATEDDQPVATFKLEREPGGPVLHRQGQAGKPGSPPDQNDCTVTEDKVPQTLKSFVAETQQPLTLGILLDTSGSQQRVLPLEQDVAASFWSACCGRRMRRLLLSFDVNVDLLQDYTNSARLLSRAMNKAEINTAGGNGAGGFPEPAGDRSHASAPQGNGALRRGGYWPRARR